MPDRVRRGREDDRTLVFHHPYLNFHAVLYIRATDFRMMKLRGTHVRTTLTPVKFGGLYEQTWRDWEHTQVGKRVYISILCNKGMYGYRDIPGSTDKLVNE